MWIGELFAAATESLCLLHWLDTAADSCTRWHYAVWFKEHFAHSVALSHFKQNTLRNILPPASSHSWSWLACCAPVSLSSPSVCRAAVGVNGNKCQSLTIAGTLFSPALICCSDLLFRFSPLTLFFTSWAMNNKLLDAALWYGGSSNFKQTWSHKAFTRAQF